MFFMGFLGNGLHVLLVKDLECLRVAETEDFLPEELDAEGVDCTYEVAGMITSDEAIDTVAHLHRRLVGKCEAEDVAWVDSQFINEICVPICKHPCLSRAGSCNDPDLSFSRLYGLKLSFVQSSQFHNQVLRTQR